MTELTEYASTEHFNNIRQLGAELQQRIGGLTEMLVAVDQALANMGLLLNISQPASDGKLGIRWWSDGHGKRIPVFVEWKRKRLGNRKFYPVRIKNNIVRRQKWHSGYKVNGKETEKMLHFSVELMRIRGVLVKALANMSRSELAITLNNASTIQCQVAHLKTIGTRIKANNEQWALQKESGLDWKV